MAVVRGGRSTSAAVAESSLLSKDCRSACECVNVGVVVVEAACCLFKMGGFKVATADEEQEELDLNEVFVVVGFGGGIAANIMLLVVVVELYYYYTFQVGVVVDVEVGSSVRNGRAYDFNKAFPKRQETIKDTIHERILLC